MVTFFPCMKDKESRDKFELEGGSSSGSNLVNCTSIYWTRKELIEETKKN